MKKSILTRALACGILVSSFAIINCQKAPERKITPTPSAKPDANGLVQCSDDVVKLLAAHNADFKAIQDIVEKAKTTPLKPEEKAPLDKQLQAMVLKSNEMYTAIRALGKASAPALGCLEVDPKIQGGSAPRNIIEFQNKNRDLAKAVAVLTGIANDLASQFMKGNQYELSKSLADMLSNKLTYKGEGAIAAGQILTKEAYLAMKDDKTKTSCIITAADEHPVAEKAIMVITGLSDPKLDTASKRMNADLNVTIKALAADTSEENTSDRVVAFNCTLADGKDALEEVSLAFKGLADLKFDAPKVDKADDKVTNPASSDDTSSDNTKIGEDQGAQAGDQAGAQPDPQVTLPALPDPADSKSSDPTKGSDPAVAQVESQVKAQSDASAKALEIRAIGK